MNVFASDDSDLVVRTETYAKVYKLLEREAEKARVELGDRETADYVAMLIAKIKALEDGRLKID